MKWYVCAVYQLANVERLVAYDACVHNDYLLSLLGTTYHPIFRYRNPVGSIRGHPQDKVIGIHAGFACKLPHLCVEYC
jgi:hypothetical protein